MKLNCKVGDLAITVKCHCPENLGSIVRIKKSKGLITWPQEEGLLQVWEVEVANANGWLVYELNDLISSSKTGPVPDKYLRCITPPKGYLLDNFACPAQLAFDFDGVDRVMKLA